MARLEDWETRLAAAIESRSCEPRIWGENDCALTVGSFILAQTGDDPARDFRGMYSTEVGAARRMRRFAGDVADVAAKIAAENGWPEVAPAFAHRGDVVLHDHAPALALGIVAMTGTHGLFVDAVVGLDLVRVSDCCRAWSLG